MSKSVAIIIVTWNSEKDIVDCLASVFAQDYANYKVIVVDSASTDNTCNLVVDSFDQVLLYKSATNLYYAGGNNMGAKLAKLNFNSDYLLFLNPDTKVQPDLVRKLVEVAESDEKIGAVGPKVMFWANENAGLINSAGLIYDDFMHAYDRGVMEADHDQYSQQEELKAISGTAMLVRANLFEKLGGFWEKLQLYLEDLELCIRIHKAGYKTVYTPTTVVLHKYMQSTSKNKQYQVEKNKLRNWYYIAGRHYSLRSWFAVARRYWVDQLFA